MPSIPIYRAQAQPSESTKPLIRDPESVGLQERAWTSAVGAVSKRAEQYQAEQDALSVSETLSKLNDREREFMFNKDSGQLTMRGANASGATQRGVEFYDNSIKDLASGLMGNQEKMFREQASRLRTSGLDRLSTHEANEHQTRKQDVINTRVEEVRQKIRNGATQDDIDKEVRQGLFGVIDQAFSGLDMTDMKNKVRDQIFSEYLDQVAVTNPGGIVEATGKWHGLMDTAVLNKYLQKVDMSNAIRELHSNPDKFKASDYASLDPVQQANLQEQATRLSEARLNKRVHEYERFQRQVEKAEKDQREANDMAALILFGKPKEEGGMGIEDVELLGIRKKLSPDIVKYLQTRDREGYNDPVVVGDIAEGIEMKRDMGPQLNNALTTGRIKKETYIQFKKQIGNDKYWEALTRMRGAFEPSPMDKFSEDRHLKWENAFTYFNTLIEGSMTPAEAADTVINGHYTKVQRTVSTLPRPAFWTGGNINSDMGLPDKSAIDETRKVTAAKYTNREITPEQYSYEMKNLQDLENIWRDGLRLRTQKSMDETAKKGGGAPSNTRRPESNKPKF